MVVRLSVTSRLSDDDDGDEGDWVRECDGDVLFAFEIDSEIVIDTVLVIDVVLLCDRTVVGEKDSVSVYVNCCVALPVTEYIVVPVGEMVKLACVRLLTRVIVAVTRVVFVGDRVTEFEYPMVSVTESMSEIDIVDVRVLSDVPVLVPRVSVRVSVGDFDAVFVKVTVMVNVRTDVMEKERLSSDVRVGVSVALGLLVIVGDAVDEAVGLVVCDGDVDAVGSDVNDGVIDGEVVNVLRRLNVSDGVAVAERSSVTVLLLLNTSVTEGDFEIDGKLVCDVDGVSVRVTVREGLCVRLAVLFGVSVYVGHTLGDTVGDGDCEVELLGLSVSDSVHVVVRLGVLLSCQVSVCVEVK